MSRVFTKPYEACIQSCLDCNVQSSRVSAAVFWFTIISLYRPPGPLRHGTRRKGIQFSRDVCKSRIHDRRDYRDFRLVPSLSAIAVILCHGRDYHRNMYNFNFQTVNFV